jgi:hypothetical protein
MRFVCAWCESPMGGRGSLVTHGICRDCLTDMFEPQFGFMESLPPAEPPPARPASPTRRRAKSGGAQPDLFSN